MGWTEIYRRKLLGSRIKMTIGRVFPKNTSLIWQRALITSLSSPSKFTGNFMPGMVVLISPAPLMI
jgi:hypothetical protein